MSRNIFIWRCNHCLATRNGHRQIVKPSSRHGRQLASRPNRLSTIIVNRFVTWPGTRWWEFAWRECQLAVRRIGGGRTAKCCKRSLWPSSRILPRNHLWNILSIRATSHNVLDCRAFLTTAVVILVGTAPSRLAFKNSRAAMAYKLASWRFVAVHIGGNVSRRAENIEVSHLIWAYVVEPCLSGYWPRWAVTGLGIWKFNKASDEENGDESWVQHVGIVEFARWSKMWGWWRRGFEEVVIGRLI